MRERNRSLLAGEDIDMPPVSTPKPVAAPGNLFRGQVIGQRRAARVSETPHLLPCVEVRRQFDPRMLAVGVYRESDRNLP